MISMLVHDSMRTHKIKNMLLMVQSVGAYMLVIFIISFMNGVERNTADVEKAAAPLYKVVDNFLGKEERNFFAQSDRLQVLNELYHWEKENQSFTYIIANRQNVYAEVDLPDMFLKYNDVQNIYKSLQVNSNFFDYFSLHTREGRLFSEDDYSINNAVIPVILGSSYNGYLKLDQIIDISYLEVEFKAQIIGFLKEGSYYNNTYKLEYLDEYMIFPSLESENIYEEDSSFMLKLLLDKGNGYIASEHSAKEIQQMLTEQCLKLDIIPYSLLGFSNFFLTMWGLEGKQLQRMLTLLSMLIIFSTLVSISLNTMSKIFVNRRYYSVMIVNGLNKKIIIIAIIAEILCVNIFSLTAAFTIASCFMNAMHFLYLFMLSIILTILSSFIPCIFVLRMNLTKTMRGEY